MIPTQTAVARSTEAVIVILFLPPPECSPNWRGHWRQKARAVASFREQAAWATRFTADADVFGGKRGPVTIDVEIAWCCGRKRMDDDNVKASLKPVIDGIAQELWGGQDRHVTIGTVRQCQGSGIVTVTLRGEG